MLHGPLANCLALILACGPGALPVRPGPAAPPERLESWTWPGNTRLDRGENGWIHHLPRTGRSRAWRSADEGRGRSGALVLSTADIDSAHGVARTPVWVTVVDSLPVGTRLSFGAWVRGRDCAQGPWIGFGITDGRRRPLDGATVRPVPSLTGTFDWTRLEGTIVVPEGAERAELAAALDGSGQVWFDDFWVTAVGPADSMERRRRPPASIRGGSLPVEGGLFLVRSEECISRATSRSDAVEWPMTLALPLCDRDQVPVAYDVWTEPASAFVSARIREDRPGQHVADLRLQLAPGADSLILRWNSVVLVAPRSFVDVPERAPMPAAWPAEAGAWLRASRCAEARDVQIQSLAAGIRLGSQDLLEIVHRTLAEVRDVRRTRQGAAVTFNSVEALTREGSCLSDVHLVTALLRANGIPARIVSGLPTLGRPTSVHFIAEAWIPGAGWYPLEPTVGFAPWPRSEFVRLAIVPVDYEDRGAIRASGEGSPCLPYLAVSEAPLAENGLATFGLVDRAHGVPRAVEGIRRFGAGRNPASWIPVIEVASAQWHAWLSSGPALDANHHFATARTAGDWRTGEPLRDLLRPVADP